MSIATTKLWDCWQTEYLDRTSWLAARKSGIGASESASIFGVGYKGSSPVTVWYDKTTNELDQSEPTALMRRGSRMEPVIAAEFADESGLEIIDPGRVWADSRRNEKR